MKIKEQLVTASAMLFGFDSKKPKQVASFLYNDEASLDDKVIGLVVVCLLVALVLIPIGISALNNVNKTAAGIDTGSTQETIVDNLPVIFLIGVLIGGFAYMRMRQ